MNRFKIYPMRYAAEGQYEIREYHSLEHYSIRIARLTLAEARAGLWILEHPTEAAHVAAVA